MRRSILTSGPAPRATLAAALVAVATTALAAASPAAASPSGASRSAAAPPPGALRAAAVPTALDRYDVPVTLRGSLAAMRRQHGVARELGIRFVKTPAEMAWLLSEGDLVSMPGNDDYALREGVRSLSARPEMRTFIERLSRDYHEACGERLVVTSLTRPKTRQPRNAHRLSVHPAGIAVDLRVSRRMYCRHWLERRLLAMEADEVLDVTRERTPPHYHVALFPAAYMSSIEEELAAERAGSVAVLVAAWGPAGPPAGLMGAWAVAAPTSLPSHEFPATRLAGVDGAWFRDL